MSEKNDTSGQTILVLPGRYAICRLNPDAAVLPWALSGEFQCIARTADELSIVCAEDAVPAGVRAEPGWRCLRVAGTLDFGLVGVLASLLGPLAAAGVSVLPISTFDTDWLLVRDSTLSAAVTALLEAGHCCTSG